MDSIRVIEIKQIYNFISEHPNIIHSNNINRIQLFIEEYYYGRQVEIDICDTKNLLNIEFSNNETLNFDIRALPNFLKSEEFIPWCINFLMLK